MPFDYTVRFTFSTAKAGRGAGQIVGRMGGGEFTVTADEPLPDLQTWDADEKKELEVLCFQFLSQDPKAQKMGTVISLDVEALSPVEQEESEEG